MEDSQLGEILQRMKNPQGGIILKNRRWRLKQTECVNSFVGRECVDWLMKNYSAFCKTREEAKKIGKKFGLFLLCRKAQRMLSNDLIFGTDTKASVFSDDYVFYFFEKPKVVYGNDRSVLYSKSKGIPPQTYEKPKIVPMEFIPSLLEDASYIYLRSKLLKDGFVLSQYKDTGTMILCHPEYPNEYCRIGNNEKIVALAIHLPLIISIHEARHFDPLTAA